MTTTDTREDWERLLARMKRTDHLTPAYLAAALVLAIEGTAPYYWGA